MKTELITHKNPNLIETPFSVKASPYIIGLEKEKKLLIQYIKNGDICFLTGNTGVGKSSLLLWIKHNLNSPNVFYIDAANIEKGFSIKEFLKNSKKWFDIFGTYPKNAIVLLDESQDCDYDLQKALKLHWDHGHIKSIIITQINKLENFSDSFQDRIGKRIIKLEGLNKSEAINLINSRLGNTKLFGEKAIEKIIETANYIPRKILEFCELVYLKNKDKKKIELVDVKKVLNEKSKKKKSKQKKQIDEPDEPQENDYEFQKNAEIINKIQQSRLTLLQKRIVRNLDQGKTIPQISYDLALPQEKINKELDNLQKLGVINLYN